jgi:hypothetical protein
VLLNGTIPDHGSIELVGGPPTQQAYQYVDFPNFMLAGLESITLEFWLTWSGSSDSWQRIFDFGSDESNFDVGADDRTLQNGQSYLFLTPRSDEPNDPRTPRLAFLKPGRYEPTSDDGSAAVFKRPGSGTAFRRPAVETLEVRVDATRPLPTGVETHVAVTIDRENRRMALFVNGTLAGPATQWNDSLRYVYDVNAWLGRSQYRDDSTFSGSFNEFRIYAGALSDERILASYLNGPDAADP